VKKISEEVQFFEKNKEKSDSKENNKLKEKIFEGSSEKKYSSDKK